MCSVQCAMMCASNSVQCAVYNVQCLLFSVESAVKCEEYCADNFENKFHRTVRGYFDIVHIYKRNVHRILHPCSELS